MQDVAFAIAASAAPITAISLLIKRVYDGKVAMRRADYEGEAKLIRARRGDPEPMIVVQRGPAPPPALGHLLRRWLARRPHPADQPSLPFSEEPFGRKARGQAAEIFR